MDKVIKTLEHELLWKKTTLSNLRVSLNDAENSIKRVKEYIKDTKQEIRDLEASIKALTEDKIDAIHST